MRNLPRIIYTFVLLLCGLLCFAAGRTGAAIADYPANKTITITVPDDTVYQLELSVDDYSMTTGGFSVKSKKAFGANRTGNLFTYYPNNQDSAMLRINAKSGAQFNMIMEKWDATEVAWVVTSPDSYAFTVKGLRPGVVYRLGIDQVFRTVTAKHDGSIAMKKLCKSPTRFVVKVKA